MKAWKASVQIAQSFLKKTGKFWSKLEKMLEKELESTQ